MKDFLIQLGLDPSLRGFRYFAALCEDFAADNDKPMMMRYAAVAKAFGVDARNVERCCRFLIEKLCNSVPIDQYSAPLLCLPDMNTGLYTVSKFLALVSLAYQRKCKLLSA